MILLIVIIQKSVGVQDLKKRLEKGEHIDFVQDNSVPAIYRPFTKQWLYLDPYLNERVYQMPRLFPRFDAHNRLICVAGPGTKTNFPVMMVDSIPDLGFVPASQCFPLYLYEKNHETENMFERPAYRYAITDKALAVYQQAYGPQVSKEDIFYYTYGVLHVPSYREQFVHNLQKELPRIPLVQDPAHFTALVKAGRALGELHVGFDQVEPWPLEFAQGGWIVPEGMDAEDYFRVTKSLYENHVNRSTS